MVSLTLNFIAGFLALATLVPLSTQKMWWVRAFDFPRVQVLVFIALWFLISAGIIFIGKMQGPNVWLALVLFLCAGVHLRYIYPFTVLAKKEVAAASAFPQQSISLLSSNVLMPNRNSESLIALVNQYQPDLLITLETDQWWQTQLEVLDEYPHRVCYPLDNLYGMHLFSRLPLDDAHVDFLVDDEIPSICADVKLSEVMTVRLHVLHPTPPVPGENNSSLDRDVELLVLADALKDSDKVTLVVGDLNDVAWSRTTRLFREVSGFLDPRIGRGMFNSFHAHKWYMRWPIDHIFMSKHFRVMEMKRLPSISSDHFPIYAKLEVKNVEVRENSQTLIATDETLLHETLDTEVAEQASTPTLK